jgi:hypothetical protein
VVGVENDGNTVDGSNGADVVSGGDSSGDGSLALFLAVLDTLSSEVGGPTLGSLEYDGRALVSRCLKGSDSVEAAATCQYRSVSHWIVGSPPCWDGEGVSEEG